MSESPRTMKNTERTTKQQSTASPVVIMLMTGLDTTWRLFIPVLGGTFLGIGLDKWLHIEPIATVVCLILGVIASALLIIKQLKDVQKPLK